MGKKSGTAGTPTRPEEPEEPELPDKADPGEAKKAKAEQAQVTKLEPGATMLDASSNDADEAAEEEKGHWIGIKLVDEDGRPVPGERFRLALPGGEIVEGTLDETGQARVEGLPEGSGKVCFPDMDKDRWRTV